MTDRATHLAPAAPLPASGCRPLRVTSLSLACCALEANAAIESWKAPADTDSSLGPLNVLVVAGTLTRANSGLLIDAYAQLPEPRAVVAFGVCTISGGPYWDSYAVLPGIAELVRVTTFVPGCPPLPTDLIEALLGLARPQS